MNTESDLLERTGYKAPSRWAKMSVAERRDYVATCMLARDRKRVAKTNARRADVEEHYRGYSVLSVSAEERRKAHEVYSDNGSASDQLYGVTRGVFSRSYRRPKVTRLYSGIKGDYRDSREGEGALISTPGDRFARS